MTNLIENLEPYIKEQLIITTHNLMLLNINKFQDYFYFIDIDQNGTHTVNTIKDSNIRIQSYYNLMFKYIKGCFKGIPWENMNIDFSKFNNDHTYLKKHSQLKQHNPAVSFFNYYLILILLFSNTISSFCFSI